MGTGRTLRKESHVRPCKTPAGKARKNKAQRARLVKLGMEAEAVKKMGDDDVRILVQRPAVVKKLVAKKVEEKVKLPKPPAKKPDVIVLVHGSDPYKKFAIALQIAIREFRNIVLATQLVTKNGK